MSLWIPITLAAALFQTLRFVLQKTLATSTLSAGGATFARFVYSAPLVALLLALYLGSTGQALPQSTLAFWVYGAAGGLAQVLATICVVLLFKARNFAVGITFKKTETIQAVLVGLVLLGEGVSWPGFAAILLGVLGVLLLSVPPGQARFDWRDLGNRASKLGLSAGFLFAISAVCYRGASLEIEASDPLLRAGTTLAAVTAMQMIGMAIWLRLRQPGEIAAVWRARRVALWVGVM
ncbi:MAG: EamA/RhaT family transporter, partial [Pseudomonadota bacterium]